MKSKGKRGGGAREGYRWLKSWLQQRRPGEGRVSDDSGKGILEAVGQEALLRWIPRLFREGSEADRKEILRELVPEGGPAAAPFLEEVLASPESSLVEKRIALEQFEASARQGDAGFEDNLRQAEEFVASLPASLLDADTPDAVPEEVEGTEV